MINYYHWTIWSFSINIYIYFNCEINAQEGLIPLYDFY